jgi:predicted transcriptional regulator
MAKVRVNFMLDEALADDLQRAAKAQSESMSLIVRQALRSHFRQSEKAAA